MTIDKDELKDLIEQDLFGGTDLSLDEITAKSGKASKTKKTLKIKSDKRFVDLNADVEDEDGTHSILNRSLDIQAIDDNSFGDHLDAIEEGLKVTDASVDDLESNILGSIKQKKTVDFTSVSEPDTFDDPFDGLENGGGRETDRRVIPTEEEENQDLEIELFDDQIQSDFQTDSLGIDVEEESFGDIDLGESESDKRQIPQAEDDADENLDMNMLGEFSENESEISELGLEIEEESFDDFDLGESESDKRQIPQPEEDVDTDLEMDMLDEQAELKPLTLNIENEEEPFGDFDLGDSETDKRQVPQAEDESDADLDMDMLGDDQETGVRTVSLDIDQEEDPFGDFDLGDNETDKRQIPEPEEEVDPPQLDIDSLGDELNINENSAETFGLDVAEPPAQTLPDFSEGTIPFSETEHTFDDPASFTDAPVRKVTVNYDDLNDDGEDLESLIADSETTPTLAEDTTAEEDKSAISLLDLVDIPLSPIMTEPTVQATSPVSHVSEEHKEPQSELGFIEFNDDFDLLSEESLEKDEAVEQPLEEECSPEDSKDSEEEELVSFEELVQEYDVDVTGQEEVSFEDILAQHIASESQLEQQPEEAIVTEEKSAVSEELAPEQSEAIVEQEPANEPAPEVTVEQQQEEVNVAEEEVAIIEELAPEQSEAIVEQEPANEPVPEVTVEQQQEEAIVAEEEIAIIEELAPEQSEAIVGQEPASEPEIVAVDTPAVAIEPEPEVIVEPKQEEVLVMQTETIIQTELASEPEVIAVDTPEVAIEPEPEVIEEPKQEEVLVTQTETIIQTEPASEPEVIAIDTPEVAIEPEPEVIEEPKQEEEIFSFEEETETSQHETPPQSEPIRQPEPATVAPEPQINVQPIEFPELQSSIAGRNFDLDFFGNIPVKIDVFLGQSSISLKDIYELTEGSIIELDKLIAEPLELRINGQLIALGEVVAVDHNYGILLKEIIKPKK